MKQHIDHRNWKWYWQTDDEIGHADCGIFQEDRPGHATSICRAPRYVTKEQWEANANYICLAAHAHYDLVDALKYARRFLNKADHDTDYIDAILLKAQATPKDQS